MVSLTICLVRQFGVQPLYARQCRTENHFSLHGLRSVIISDTTPCATKTYIHQLASSTTSTMDGFVENEFAQYRGSQEQTAPEYSLAPQAGIRTDQWMLTRNLERPAIYSGQTFPYQPFSGAIRFQPPQASHNASLPLPDLSHGSSARYYEPSSLTQAPLPFPLSGYGHTNQTVTEPPLSGRHRSGKKQIHKDEDWAQHRHEIRRLYVDEDRTLQDTMARMASEHNFHAS